MTGTRFVTFSQLTQLGSVGHVPDISLGLQVMTVIF